MTQDPITDIVNSMNLAGAVFLNAEFSAPWSIYGHITEEECRPYMPIPRQIIAYHVVIEGDLLLALDQSGETHKWRAKAGDVIVLPKNPVHMLSSGTGLKPALSDDLVLPAGGDGLMQIRHGGGGEETRIMCGFMASEASGVPLWRTLPDVMIVNTASLQTRQWIEASVRMAARELSEGRVQGGSLVRGLCQLLLTEALRTHIAENRWSKGWLAGMANPRIAHALSLIHGSLQNPPSVEVLAREVSMSRSAFVDRFTDVMGFSPRRYILLQRMELAASLLREGKLTASEIGFRVGYDAPEAFSRAFKRELGLSPLEWRRQATGFGC